MKRILKQITTISFIFIFLLSPIFFLAGNVVRAAECDPGTECYKRCSDPNSPGYTSALCTKYKLGLQNVDVNKVWLSTAPAAYITLFFQLALGVVVVIVTYRIVKAGIDIANAKEDADKRKEGFMKVLNAVIGMIVAFSAYGIVGIIIKLTGANPDYRILRSCADLQRDAANGQIDPLVVAHCQKTQGAPTPTPPPNGR